MTDTDDVCSHWRPADCEGSVHCPPRCPRFVDRTGEPWVIRPTSKQERGGIVQLYDDEPLERLPCGARKRPQLRNLVDKLLTEGCNFVVTGNDRVVGHALYNPTDDLEPECKVFVHREYRNRGIGTALSKHVVATAAAADRSALTITVDPGNRRARELCDALGFKIIEQFSYEQRDSKTGIMRMRLPLSKAVSFDAQGAPAFTE